MKIVSPTEAARRRVRGVALQREGNARELPRADFVVLSTFNLDFFPPLLSDALDSVGLYGEVRLGGFGQIAQAAMDPSSALYSSQARNIIMVPAVQDVLAPLFSRPSELTAAERAELVEERIAELGGAIRTILDRVTDATVYLVVFGSPHAPGAHILDPLGPARGQRVVEEYLQRIRAMSADDSRVVIVDWDWHTRSLGTAAFL